MTLPNRNQGSFFFSSLTFEVKWDATINKDESGTKKKGSDNFFDQLEIMSLSENEKKMSEEEPYFQKVSSSDDSLLDKKSTGVRKAEILAEQWDTWYYKLILLFSAFLVGYAYGLDGQTRYIYNSFATNSYAQHSLFTTVGVISSVAQAVAQILYARLSDVFGRLELFIVSILFYVVGTVIESQAYDIERYAAGSVFYSIGYAGLIIVLLLILSDFSSLKWRLFYSFVPAFPFIINTWISGNVTSAVGLNWSWGIGMWAFILPLCCIPLLCCMVHMRWKAGKTQAWKEFKDEKTKFQELGLGGFLKFLFWTLDIIGLVLIVAMLGCILVPLTIAGGASTTWQEAHIIVPIVVGCVLIPVFVFWEAKSKHAIVPFYLLKDRGIWSALYISMSINLISSIEASFLYTVLVVAVNESIKSATRITSLNSFVSVVGGFFFGLVVVYFRRLKGFIVFGTCIWLVALGILLHFRSGLNAHAGIIGGVCLLGFGTTFFTYPINVSMQSCVNHEHMAVITALGYSLYRVGSAIGSAVAGAIWTQLLPPKIGEQMDKYNINNATAQAFAYNQPLLFVVEYPWGSDARMALAAAYREIQWILVLVAMLLCVPMIIMALFTRDNVLGDEQSIDDIETKERNERLLGFLSHSTQKVKNPKAALTKEKQPAAEV